MKTRPPFFRMSLANATLVSAMYLVSGAAGEVLRRTLNLRWAERLSRMMEAFPMQVLEKVGLLEPLRRGWLEGHISDLQVRLVYGLTAVVIIYALGLGVGAGMWLWERVSSRG